MENFVREDLFDILCTECVIDKHEQASLKNFYGLYHAKKDKFRFLPGEKIMLKRIADYVKNFNPDDDNLNQYKPPKKYKISRKDTCRLFGGIYYGKKKYFKKYHGQFDDMVHDIEQQTETINREQQLPLRSKLLCIAKEKYESKYPNLSGKDYLNVNMVQVVKNGNRITGTVQCIFCSAEKKIKSITIQYDDKYDGSHYWNFSNLFKHFKRHTSIGDAEINYDEILVQTDDQCEKCTDYETLDDVKKEHIDDNVYTEMNDEDKFEEVDVIVLDKTDLNSSGEIIAEEPFVSSNVENVQDTSNSGSEISQCVTDLDINSIEFALFEQVSRQNLILTKTLYSNSEKKHSMNFILNGNETKIEIVKIRGDGSCLYSSTAHQIFKHKVNSINHKKATKSLRADVVSYIIINMKDFLYDIAGRIQEEEEESLGFVKTKWCNIKEDDCIKFVKNRLVKDNFYGGSESVKAITYMHNINVMVINEMGPPYFPLGFNANYHKTIFIAYRLKPNSNDVRNHYDSVAEVNTKILFDVVKVVIDSEVKKEVNNHEIMEIN